MKIDIITTLLTICFGIIVGVGIKKKVELAYIVYWMIVGLFMALTVIKVAGY